MEDRGSDANLSGANTSTPGAPDVSGSFMVHQDRQNTYGDHSAFDQSLQNINDSGCLRP